MLRTISAALIFKLFYEPVLLLVFLKPVKFVKQGYDFDVTETAHTYLFRN